MIGAVLILVLQLINISTSQYDANYYLSLWNGLQQQMAQYERPTRNEEFSQINPNDCVQDPEVYDYIIVGAGTAGCVLANRLSESAKVLLIEAGGNETDWSLIPAAYIAARLSRMNWGYLTTPQRYACFGSENFQCDAARGKVLGGTSAINNMLHIRGNKLDFDHWASMGNTGWDYENVLPYFKKSEKIYFEPSDQNYHGFKGPLTITHAFPKVAYTDHIIHANKLLNLTQVDYNGINQIGVSMLQRNIKHGRRNSANQAYLQPVLKKSGLKLKTQALVSKINFLGNSAAGVNYLSQGKCHTAQAQKEVIISAGAFNTPQLLMLSGIGPKSDLMKLNIQVKVDLPVGQNLLDHPAVQALYVHTNKSITVPTLNEAMNQYVGGGGWMTYSGGLEVGFNKTEEILGGVPTVETLYSLLSDYTNYTYGKKCKNYNYQLDTANGEARPTDILMNLVLLHPRSSGTVTLQTSSPIDFPLIDPNYLSDTTDIDQIYEGIQTTLKLLNTQPFKAINATLQDFPIEACSKYSGKSKWYCIIRYKLGSTNDFSSTSRMGTNTTTSVVGPDLKVHGIEKLRIVDASVVPYPTSGGLNAVVVMIAEKAAEMIYADNY